MHFLLVNYAISYSISLLNLYLKSLSLNLYLTKFLSCAGFFVEEFALLFNTCSLIIFLIKSVEQVSVENSQFSFVLDF